jgi:hypothetical protein
MSLEEAIRAARDGALIDFDVTPGARRAAVPSGYNPWRRRIEAKLASPPEKGRANEELINALAGLFGVPASRIEIVSGATDSRKSVLVYGLGVEKAAEVLRSRIHG